MGASDVTLVLRGARLRCGTADALGSGAVLELGTAVGSGSGGSGDSASRAAARAL